MTRRALLGAEGAFRAREPVQQAAGRLLLMRSAEPPSAHSRSHLACDVVPSEAAGASLHAGVLTFYNVGLRSILVGTQGTPSFLLWVHLQGSFLFLPSSPSSFTTIPTIISPSPASPPPPPPS